MPGILQGTYDSGTVVTHPPIQTDIYGNIITVGPGSGTVPTVDILKIASHAVDHNAGAVGDGTIRVTTANDKATLISATSAVNAVTNPIFSSISATAAANAVGNPIYAAVSATTAANAVGNPIYASVSATGAANVVTNPMFVKLTDGTTGVGVVATTGELKTLDTNSADIETAVQLIDNMIGTDGAAVPTGVAAVGGTDGTNLQTLKVDANGQVYVLMSNALAFEDETNLWGRVQMNANLELKPAKTTTTIDAAAHEILASVDILQYKTVRLWVHNTGVTNAFTAATLYASPDGTTEYAFDAANVTTAIGTLATATLSSYLIKGGSATLGDGIRFIRLIATATANSTTCDVWLTGSIL